MYHRVGFTAAQSAELWERWKKGEGLKSIGRAFGIGAPHSASASQIPAVAMSNDLEASRLRPAAASELYPIADDVEGANFHCHRLDQETNRVHVASPFSPNDGSSSL
jgi:hypothetical protein